MPWDVKIPSSDWMLVWLTLALALVGLLQLIVFGLQARRLRQTIDTMKKLGSQQSADTQASIAVAQMAADATTIQAKAVVDVERPIIVAQNYKLFAVKGKPFSLGTLPAHPVVSMRFQNYGRSPAEVLSYFLATKVAKGLPETPEQHDDYPVAPGTMIPPNGWLEFPLIFEWTADERSEIINGDVRLWVFGRVAYRDFLGQCHRRGFCAMAVPGENQTLNFVYSGDTPPGYSYLKID